MSIGEELEKVQRRETSFDAFWRTTRREWSMMAVALFSDLTRGKELYKNSIRPPLQEAIQTIITDISGWDPPHVDMNVIVEGFFGLHYGVALEGLLGIRDIDIKDTARQITMIFAGGVRERDGGRATDLQKP